MMNLFLLSGDNFISEMNSRQPRFNDSEYGPFGKKGKEYEKLKKLVD